MMIYSNFGVIVMLVKLETFFEYLGFIGFAGYLLSVIMLVLGCVVGAVMKINMPNFFINTVMLLIVFIALYILSLLFFVIDGKIHDRK